MHPTSHPGEPPYDYGDLSGWPPSARLAPPPRPGPPPGPPPVPPQATATPGLDALRRRVGRLDRALITVNAASFAALVLLAGAAPGLLAVDVVGQINLGLLLCAALGVVSLCTSIRYDRRYSREVDPEADRIRTRHEERVAATATAAQERAAGRRWSGW
ncbi:DUF485 domain-containing protein [Streptacidiphilus anmyonensis]|uniref:DUF485 domain-containing protein n=1 Tax=Streptacidiphilus anmyonensis TaxID=405782 RepID=UPI000694F497|nr:DUF485 domain-containing protein [Streptacidiphilus anmyonensis]